MESESCSYHAVFWIFRIPSLYSSVPSSRQEFFRERTFLLTPKLDLFYITIIHTMNLDLLRQEQDYLSLSIIQQPKLSLLVSEILPLSYSAPSPLYLPFTMGL